MSTISDILTTAFTTSREADQAGKELKGFIGAESNYEVVLIAIGVIGFVLSLTRGSGGGDRRSDYAHADVGHAHAYRGAGHRHGPDSRRAEL